MKRKRMALLFLVTLLAGAAAGPTTGQQQGAPSADPSLVAGSKKAILETGISEAYFDRHFRLARVVAAEGDRRVEWKFSVNGYEALLVDDIGYNTSEAGERVDVHSIKSELYSAHDITRTIPKRRARAALRTCIGEYADAMVVYRALKAPGKAGLYLTARAKIDFGDEGEEEEGEEEGEGGREVEGFSFNVGFIDLETGKCTVEKGQVTP